MRAVSAFRDALHEADRRLDEVLDEVGRLVAVAEREDGFVLVRGGLLLGRVLGLGRAGLANEQFPVLTVLLHVDDGGGIGLVADFALHGGGGVEA